MSVKHSPATVVVRLSSGCSACSWPLFELAGAVGTRAGVAGLVCIYLDCYKHFLVMLTHQLPKCRNKHKPRSEVQRGHLI